jgi:excisionase family DNA binding protein
MTPATMTTEQVCAALNITRRTLHKWEQEGKIGFTRIGERKKLYLESEVNDLIWQNYKK